MGLEKLNATRYFVARCVSAGVLECHCRSIGGDDVGMRQFAGQRNRDTARTRSHIGNSQRLCTPPAETPERNFDHVLGRRPGGQHPRPELAFEAPELWPACTVLGGNALPASPPEA